MTTRIEFLMDFLLDNDEITQDEHDFIVLAVAGYEPYSTTYKTTKEILVSEDPVTCENGKIVPVKLEK